MQQETKSRGLPGAPTADGSPIGRTVAVWISPLAIGPDARRVSGSGRKEAAGAVGSGMGSPSWPWAQGQVASSLQQHDATCTSPQNARPARPTGLSAKAPTKATRGANRLTGATVCRNRHTVNGIISRYYATCCGAHASSLSQLRRLFILSPAANTRKVRAILSEACARCYD